MISPSSMTCYLPCCLYLPSALTAFSLPCSTKSTYFMISAQMKPFSKSVWITPAACGALVFFLMVQHLTSSQPAVKKQIRSRALQPALMILGIMDLLFSSLGGSSMWARSQLALQGIISPGTLASMYYLIFFNHLFFLLMKSSSLRLTKYTTCLAVISLCVLSRAIYLPVQSPFLTHLFLSSRSFALISSYISSLASLLLVRFTCLSRSSMRLITYSRSFSTSSVLMISMSRMGLTSASVWVTSSSQNARSTWQIPSTYLMLLRKWLPRPSPLDAPRTSPAISTTCNTADTSDLGFHISHSLLKRGSGTGTTALLGSMVQKGQFQAGTFNLASTLKVDDLPTLGSPTIPILRVLPGRPHKGFSSVYGPFFGGMDPIPNQYLYQIQGYFFSYNKLQSIQYQMLIYASNHALRTLKAPTAMMLSTATCIQGNPFFLISSIASSTFSSIFLPIPIAPDFKSSSFQ